MNYESQTRRVFQLLMTGYNQHRKVSRLEFDDLFPRIENITARLSNLRKKLQIKGWSLICDSSKGHKRTEYYLTKI